VTTPLGSDRSGRFDSGVERGGVGLHRRVLAIGPKKTILEVVPNAPQRRVDNLDDHRVRFLEKRRRGSGERGMGRLLPSRCTHKRPYYTLSFPTEAFSLRSAWNCGTAVDVTVTTPSGSTTAKAAFHYATLLLILPLRPICKPEFTIRTGILLLHDQAQIQSVKDHRKMALANCRPRCK